MHYHAVSPGLVHHDAHQIRQTGTDKRRLAHPLKVDERRIAQYSGVGVEQAEAHAEYQHANKVACRELPEILCKTVSSKFQIAAHVAREEHCEAVYKQYTPIG